MIEAYCLNDDFYHLLSWGDDAIALLYIDPDVLYDAGRVAINNDLINDVFSFDASNGISIAVIVFNDTVTVCASHDLWESYEISNELGEIYITYKDDPSSKGIEIIGTIFYFR